MPEKTELENVIISAVKHGVYENDGHWWWELCRLSDEIERERAAEQNAHLTGGESAAKVGFLTLEEDAAIKADNTPTHPQVA